MSWPMPSPISSIPTMIQISGLSAVRKVSQKKPATMKAVPVLGKIV